MLKLASMGLAGILLVCVSGLMLKKNGLSHAATPMHKHDQKKINDRNAAAGPRPYALAWDDSQKNN